MKDVILTCPFCNAGANVEMVGIGTGKYVVECETVGCAANGVTSYADTAGEAIRKWNKRANSPRCMAANFQFTVTKKVFESFLQYVEECGYSITKEKDRECITYFSYDCPYYGRLTPVGFECKDVTTNRWKRIIFMRLPDEKTRRIIED